MATGQGISTLTALAEALAAGDLLVITNVSDTSGSDDGTSVKVTLTQLLTLVEGSDFAFTGNVNVAGAESFTMGPVSFEGSTADDYETSFSVTDPTADRTISVGDYDTRIPAASSVNTDGSIIGIMRALAVADLDDTTTPSVLTVTETTNTNISNYKTTGADHVFTMPEAHAAGGGIFTIGDEFQVDIEPDSGDNFYLNGTAMAADEHIVNDADTLGQYIVYWAANINGTLTWMFESKYDDFVEATP